MVWWLTLAPPLQRLADGVLDEVNALLVRQPRHAAASGGGEKAVS